MMSLAEKFDAIVAALKSGEQGKKIAERFGVERNTVSRIRNGKQTTLRPPRAEQMARAAIKRAVDPAKYDEKVAAGRFRIIRHDGVVLAGGADVDRLRSQFRCFMDGKEEGWAKLEGTP